MCNSEEFSAVFWTGIQTGQKETTFTLQLIGIIQSKFLCDQFTARDQALCVGHCVSSYIKAVLETGGLCTLLGGEASGF